MWNDKLRQPTKAVGRSGRPFPEGNAIRSTLWAVYIALNRSRRTPAISISLAVTGRVEVGRDAAQTISDEGVICESGL